MELIKWVLPVLIALPLAGGVLAGIITNDRVRNALVTLLAVLIAAGGIAVVYLSTANAGQPWSLTVDAKWAHIGGALELAIIAFILLVALRIKNAWIALFALLQLIGVAIPFIIPEWFTGPSGIVSHEAFELFKIDNLSRIMLLVSCCVGAAILIFSIGYMQNHKHHAPEGAGSLQRFYFVFLSFLGLMIGLVVSNHLSFFSFFWEGTTLCSYALIGQDGGKARSENAVRALLINSFGGVLLVLGVLALRYATGHETFDQLAMHHTLPMVLLAAVLLSIAAFTKSALFPFQSWLLGAMVAPTPVSAMLHAATMVKAGVYLVMRLMPNFHDDVRVTMVVAFAGAITFLGGALLACTQSNGKRVLAYSTISNLGLVVTCAGINSPLAYAAGLAIISFHAISKGLLFLCVGRIEQKIGSRDIEDMDGLMFKMPFTSIMILIGMMSMLLPPFGMLLSKWLAIEATMRSPFLLVFMVLGSALTVYFWAKWIGRIQHTGYHPTLPKEELPSSMKFSLGLLALMVLATGVTTMLILNKVFVPMAESAYSLDTGICMNLDSLKSSKKLLTEAATFPALIIFGAVAIAGIIHYLICWHGFKREWVRKPFLCGENVSSEEVASDSEVRSYDFHSVGGKIEHSHVTNYYFHGIINEKLTTGILNWAAWLIILVLIGNTLTCGKSSGKAPVRPACNAVPAVKECPADPMQCKSKIENQQQTPCDRQSAKQTKPQTTEGDQTK
ncbi:MAG: NADH-quinone oxidoreductase subunit L [Lentisphaerae bacterium]|nr:NADH-quinone oxidoreductase subunit L [Lentisphaerota bacterium]